MFDYSKRLTELMKLYGISGNKLAQRLNVTQTHISKITTGKGYPSYPLMNEICLILGITMNQFFNDSDGTVPPKLPPINFDISSNPLDNEIYQKLKLLDPKTKRALNQIIDAAIK